MRKSCYQLELVTKQRPDCTKWHPSQLFRNVSNPSFFGDAPTTEDQHRVVGHLTWYAREKIDFSRASVVFLDGIGSIVVVLVVVASRHPVSRVPPPSYPTVYRACSSTSQSVVPLWECMGIHPPTPPDCAEYVVCRVVLLLRRRQKHQHKSASLHNQQQRTTPHPSAASI